MYSMRRFGTTLKKHDKSHRRRRRQIWNGTGYDSLGQEDIAELSDDEWDGGDLSGLDFSQVFDEELSDSPSSSGGFLGRRAHHLVNLLAQPDDCLVRNILQIWDSDLDRIRSLDQRQILLDVNAALLQGSVNKI